ncbi:MAG: hypothetical protein ACI4GW_13840 [Lachnospiraceae bacterium]
MIYKFETRKTTYVQANCEEEALEMYDEEEYISQEEEIKGITESNLRENLKGKVYTKEEELLILDGIRKCVLRYAAGISQENCGWHKEYQNYLSKKQKELEQ